MHNNDNNTNDYIKFRGTCKQACEDACFNDPSLTLVRGYYYEPIWNTKEQHWWTTRSDGSIFDPTVKQFPSAGLGTYIPFDEMIECSNCGAIVKESKIKRFENRYAFCSNKCFGRFVGLI